MLSFWRNFIFFALALFLSFGSILLASWQQELQTKIAQGHKPEWMMEQIQEDLAPFKTTGITQANIWQIVTDYPTYGFVLCTIQNNRFSWLCSSSSVVQDFRTQMFTHSMQELCQAVPLPNVVFLLFIGESYCEKTNAPVLSWCKHKDWDSANINIPDYEALSGNYNFLKEVQIGIERYPWDRKRNMAFWRGGTTGGWGFDFMPRLKLAQLSEINPEFVDAKFSGIFPSQYEDLEIRMLLLPHVGTSISVADHLRYKYQLLVDGHVSAFSRGYWQMFANCVIFKHSSPWYQWFYRALRPYEHYIPYKADASDLVQKIKWAIEHDKEVYGIMQNANHFAKNNLKHSDIMLYVYLLLNEYAKLQK